MFYSCFYFSFHICAIFSHFSCTDHNKNSFWGEIKTDRQALSSTAKSKAEKKERRKNQIENQTLIVSL